MKASDKTHELMFGNWSIGSKRGFDFDDATRRHMRRRRNVATFEDLPLRDILSNINQFTGGRKLGGVANPAGPFSLWSNMNFNYEPTHYTLTCRNVSRILKAISRMNRQYTRLEIPRFDRTIRDKLPEICNSGVTTLKIVGNDCPGLVIGDISKAAATLGASPSLTHLDFEIFMDEVNGDIGNALAGLKSSRTLAKLRIGITTNSKIVRADYGIHPISYIDSLMDLATLEIPTLRSLRLDFGSEHLRISESELRRLIPMKHNAVLTALHLDFSRSLDGRSWRTPSADITDIGPLADLRHMPNLHTLHLILAENNLGNSGAEALGSLKHSPNLRILTLDLTSNGIATAGVRAICGINDVRGLHSLTLKLGGNDRIGIDAIHALATLQRAPDLETLHVNLSGCGIGRDGAVALLFMKPNSIIRTLRFDLQNNGIVEGMATINLPSMDCLPFHTFLDVVNVHTVHIDLSHNQIGWGVCRALSTLSGLCCMQTLHLNLSHTRCKLDYLASLWEAPALLALHLNLSGTPNSRIDAGALGALGDPLCRMQELVLKLDKSEIGDVGINVLVDAFKRAHHLAKLDLQLADNNIGNVGASALATLKTSPFLTSLILNLEGNSVGNRGAEELAGLAGMTWPVLRVDLCRNPIDKTTIDDAWRGILLGEPWNPRRSPLSEWGCYIYFYVRLAGRRLDYSADGWQEQEASGEPPSEDDVDSDGEEPAIGHHSPAVFDGSICHPQAGFSFQSFGRTIFPAHRHPCR
jgi:hypothetical protein